jgi:hypothetical protein
MKKTSTLEQFEAFIHQLLMRQDEWSRFKHYELTVVFLGPPRGEGSRAIGRSTALC